MRYFVEKTAHSPLMKYENGVLLIAGRSIPEDSISVYEPLFRFLNIYLPEITSLEIQVKLEYANSSTNRSLMSLFEVMEEHLVSGKEVSVKWYYALNDKEMLDLGSDFKDIIHIPFEIIEVESLDY